MENTEVLSNENASGGVVKADNVTEEATGLPKEKKASELISANVALVHLMKGNIGIGVLSMPSALVNAGLAVGTAGLAVVAVITIHCMHLLVNATHVLRGTTVSTWTMERWSSWPYCLTQEDSVILVSRLSMSSSAPLNLVVTLSMFFLLLQVLNSCVKTCLVWTGVSTTTSSFCGSHWSFSAFSVTCAC